MSLGHHSAAGSIAGYTYQYERALYWLAISPAGSLVGIETADDVAVMLPDGGKCLEQDKHSLQRDSTPFGNRSEDLWKTLGIWLDAIDSGEIDVSKSRFLLVTNKKLSDCLARRISIASEDKEIEGCITDLENIGKDASQSIEQLTRRILRADSRSNLLALVSRCELVDSSEASAGAELRSKIAAILQIPASFVEHTNSLIDELLGWIANSAMNSWRSGLPAWIQRDHFVNQLHAILNRYGRLLKRERAINLIPVHKNGIDKQRERPFVKQVSLITDDDDVIVYAIREFIMCSRERIRLSKEGNITDDDWIGFESSLHSRWTKIRSRILRMSKSQSEKDKGFEIFSETTENHRENLAGIQTEQVYLTSGSYHRLADRIQLGWHPRFEDLMGE